MTVAIIFYAHFIASKTGKTGLTVTVDVESVAKSDGTKAVIATGAAASEGVDGMYYYRYATADLATLDYFAVFKTADATVDVQHVPALWSNYSINADAGIAATAPASTALTNATWTDARAGKIDYLDASVNAVKTKTDNLPASPAATGDIPNAAAIAADVQTGLTAQGYTTTRAGYLDVLNGLVAAIWANVSRTLTANPGLTMADIRTAIGMAAANLDTLIAGIPAADDALLTLAHGVGSWQSGVFNLQPGDAATIATAVDAAMTASHGVGSWQRVTGVSPNIVTYVLEADGNPVASGQVWIYTDAACTNLVAYGVSDTFGQITFYLAAGTYYVKRFKDTVTLFTPTVITMVVT